MEASEEQASLAGQFIECGRDFYRRGWVMGTSGNFSALVSRDPLRFKITASGMHKGMLSSDAFVDVDADGKILAGSGKPSAETAIHSVIYSLRPETAAVLHTHSVWGTLLGDAFLDNGAIKIEGYEMLKGLAGVTTHEHTELVPIVENTQDYVALSKEIADILNNQPAIHGIYLRRHGLYTWGDSISEAQRHIEILEFLFEVLGRKSDRHG